MGEGQGVFNSNKTSIGWAIAFGCTTNCHLSVHSLALPRPGSGDDSRGGGTGTGAPGGGSRRGRRRTSGDANLSEGGGDPMSAPFLAVSAGRGHGVDVACLNVFLTAALQRVMREAVLVQAPASASVVSSASVRVVDTGVSGGIAASVAGRVGELAAVCHERVVVGAAGRRSSAGEAVSCQVKSPGPWAV